MNCGRIVGGVLFVGAVAAVCFWPKGADEMPIEESVRPVRSLVVTSGMEMPDLTFAGEVKADQSRRLAFKQSGRIERIPVIKGQSVKSGEKLAWLDPKDFENRLSKAEAAVRRDRLSFARISEAAKKNAVSREDLSKAEAQLNQSEAEYALAKRDLDETVLRAPFDCTVADVPGTELEMVSAGSPVVIIQDTSVVKIDVQMAEKYVIRYRQLKSVESGPEYIVSFDSAPGKSYPVKFVEYQAEANKHSQTYAATFMMPQPDDLLLLPGMSATVTLLGRSYRALNDLGADAVTVPENAVGVAGDGSKFVWVLSADSNNPAVYMVAKRKVELKLRTDAGLVVTGVRPGERIATAGVSVLTEGRSVTLLK